MPKCTIAARCLGTPMFVRKRTTTTINLPRFVHLYSGQEAVSTGVIRQLRQDDYVCSTYRDHVHALSKGCSAREVMAELFGKKTGLCRGQGGSMHMFSAKHNVVRVPAFRAQYSTHSLPITAAWWLRLYR